jgi:cell division protein FtsQ
VVKRFPDRIRIEVQEREAVAMTLATVDNRTYPVFLDKNGVAFAAAHRGNDGALPLLTGLALEHHVDGTRLSKKYRPLLEELALSLDRNHGEGMQKLLQSLSEIHVEDKGNLSYELTLYPIHSKVRVLLDRALNEEVLRYMMVTLDVVTSMKQDVKEIDLRYGAAVFRGNSPTASQGVRF